MRRGKIEALGWDVPGNKPSSSEAPTVDALRTFLEDACASVPPVVAVSRPPPQQATVAPHDSSPKPRTETRNPLPQLEARLAVNGKKLTEGERELGFVNEELNEGQFKSCTPSAVNRRRRRRTALNARSPQYNPELIQRFRKCLLTPPAPPPHPRLQVT